MQKSGIFREYFTNMTDFQSACSPLGPMIIYLLGFKSSGRSQEYIHFTSVLRIHVLICRKRFDNITVVRYEV
jgi:hypothetical protein